MIIMKHIYIEGQDKSKPVLLMLHGTGGDERSLLGLAKTIDKDASILSVKGNELENGMPRYFKRLAEGVFDEENLILRTDELVQFIDKAAKDYSFDRDNVIAIGYSNGANIAASMLLLHGKVLKGAILHHPTVPLRNLELKSLKDLPVFIGAGENDTITRPEGTVELEKMLKERETVVQTHWENNGHSLTRSEAQAAAEFYEQVILNNK